MRLFIDLDQHAAVQDFAVFAPAPPPQFKSQDTIDFLIYFLQAGIVQDMGAGFALKFGMVKTGDATNTILAYQTAATYLTDPNGNVYYQMQVNFNTSQMATAIGTNPSIACTIEIRYQDALAEIIHSLNLAATVFATILVETGVTPPGVSTGYPDASTIELLVHKGVANGYAGLDSTAHIPTTLMPTGVELIAHKDQPSGYPSLDSTGLIPTADIPIDNSTIVVTSGKISAPFVGGDMKKSVYDVNNDGIIDHAALADTATLATKATNADGLTSIATTAPLSTVWGRDAAGNQTLFAAPTSAGGDMLKSVYDTNNDGVVDLAKALFQDASPGALSTVWGQDASGKQSLFTAPVAGTSILTPDQGSEGWDYFDAATNARWSTSIGTGGTITYPSTFGHDSTNKNLFGVDLSTAAAVNSYAQMWFGPPIPKGFPGALGILTFEARVALQSIPSASTDQPRVLIGIGNAFGAGIVDQCLVFQYIFSANTNWTMYLSGNGVSTNPATSVTPNTSFHRYKIVTTPAWDQPVSFYIDGALVGTANLGAGNFWTETYQPMFMITKNAGSTAAFKMTVGWAHWKYQVAT